MHPTACTGVSANKQYVKVNLLQCAVIAGDSMDGVPAYIIFFAYPPSRRDDVDERKSAHFPNEKRVG